MMQLTGDASAAATWRVQAALSFKGLAYENRTFPRRGDRHALIMPCLHVGGPEPFQVHQSLAILNYLEEAHRTPSLLPQSLTSRAAARGILNIAVCDLQPLISGIVLDQIDPAARAGYTAKVYARGFEAIDVLLDDPELLVENTLTIADFAMIPDLWMASAAGFDTTPYPLLSAALTRAKQSVHFQDTKPEDFCE